MRPFHLKRSHLGGSRGPSAGADRVAKRVRRLPPVLTLLLAVYLLTPAATPDAERSDWNRPRVEWREGPVRYLLADEESKAYRTLATESERAAFIAQFWASRDADPFTPKNEAEETFWNRVGAADELFTQTTISGWRTDRGRVYILLGPPDEVNNYSLPSASELDPTHPQDGVRLGPLSDLRLGRRGAVEWIYRSLPNPEAKAGQLVTFVVDVTGEYRLSGRLASSFQWYSPPVPRSIVDSPVPPSRARGAPPRPGAPEPRASPGRLEGVMRSAEDLFAFGQASLFEKAEPPSTLQGRVTTAQFFGVVPVQTRLDFFEGSGGTTTLITLGIPEDEATAGGSPSEIQVFGQLAKVDDPSHVYRFSSSKSATDPAPRQDVAGRDHRLYQVRGILPPGEYRIHLGARVADRIGTVEDRIAVPDFGGGSLTLTGPTLAETVGERPEGDEGKAFTLGHLRLVPKLAPIYRVGLDFGFFFQTCNAHAAPADGKLHLDIDYQISTRQKGIFQPLGKSVKLRDSGNPAHAYTFPLQGWTPGVYLLTVTVTDRVSGEVRASTTAFRVE